MSKISAMQAEALGLKTATSKKPAENKPAAIKPAATAPAAAKPITKSAALAPTKPVQAKTPAKKVAIPAKPKAAAPKKTIKNVTKKDKPEKIKMERDSFTMPKDEYAQITLLKARLTSLGQPAKKSELLRAGIKLLAAMSDNTLKTTLAKIPVIKTGRPNKKG